MKTLSVLDVFSRGLNFIKSLTSKDWFFLLGAVLVLSGLQLFFTNSLVVSSLLSVFSIILNFLLVVYLARRYDGKRSFSEIFTGLSKIAIATLLLVLLLLLVSILISLPTVILLIFYPLQKLVLVVSFLLLFLFAFYSMARFYTASLNIIDGDSIFLSLKKSWNVTRGYVLKIVGYVLGLIFLNSICMISFLVVAYFVPELKSLITIVGNMTLPLAAAFYVVMGRTLQKNFSA